MANDNLRQLAYMMERQNLKDKEDLNKSNFSINDIMNINNQKDQLLQNSVTQAMDDYNETGQNAEDVFSSLDMLRKNANNPNLRESVSDLERSFSNQVAFKKERDTVRNRIFKLDPNQLQNHDEITKSMTEQYFSTAEIKDTFAKINLAKDNADDYQKIFNAINKNYQDGQSVSPKQSALNRAQLLVDTGDVSNLTTYDQLTEPIDESNQAYIDATIDAENKALVDQQKTYVRDVTGLISDSQAYFTNIKTDVNEIPTHLVNVRSNTAQIGKLLKDDVNNLSSNNWEVASQVAMGTLIEIGLASDEKKSDIKEYLIKPSKKLEGQTRQYILNHPSHKKHKQVVSDLEAKLSTEINKLAKETRGQKDLTAHLNNTIAHLWQNNLDIYKISKEAQKSFDPKIEYNKERKSDAPTILDKKG